MKPVTQDGRRARWEDHRRERRRLLLRTVRRAVTEHGPQLSMEQISAAAETTKTVLYRYFGDRTGLQQAMGQWAMRVIARSLDEADYSPHTPRQSLRAMISAFVSLAARAPEVYRFCDAAVGRTPDATGDDGTYESFFHSVTALMCERLQLRGEHEELWASGAIGFVRACTERWLHDPREQEAFVDQLTTWLWNSRSEDPASLPGPEASGTHPGTHTSGPE